MALIKLPISIFIGLLLVMTSCGDKGRPASQGPPPVSVTVHKVSTADAAYYDEYPAIVRALNEVELRPQVNGYITAIHFKEGARVKKGEKLYSIDQQQSQAAYQQALANLSVQQANLEKSKKDVDRYRELDSKDAIAKQQVDYAESAYSAALQQVEAAKATVKSVQTNVRYSTIVAPFDGTIGISMVRLGASVSPGQTLLNTLSSDDPIAADIVVDQNEILRFTKLKQEKLLADSAFRLVFRDGIYPGYGKISFIDRAVDPQTGSIKMRLVFPNPTHALRPGMSGTVQVLTHAREAVLIPYKAISEQLGEFFTYVVEGDKVTQRKVILGEQVGRNIIIKDGLQKDEVIVLEGIQNLREGSAINIANSPTK